MALTISEYSKEGQECFKYLDNQPIYMQSHVTDCIVNSGNIIIAADLFDETSIEFLKKYKPEFLNEYLIFINIMD